MFIQYLVVVFMLSCGIKSCAADGKDVMGVTLNWLRSGLKVCEVYDPSVTKRVGLDSLLLAAPRSVILPKDCGVDSSKIKLLPKTPLLISSSRLRLQLDLLAVPAFDSESDDELLLLNEKYRDG